MSDVLVKINSGSKIKTQLGGQGASETGLVKSVNGKTGNVVLTADDVHALPSSTVIPEKISDLINDSDFVTEEQVESKLDKNQGVENAGKVMKVSSTGNLVPMEDGSGAVDSVNGKTGAVELNADDVGAASADALSTEIERATTAEEELQTRVDGQDTVIAEQSETITTMREIVETTENASVTLTNRKTVVVTNQPTALTVGFNAPVSGIDYTCGLIFKAGASFALTETAPTGYAVKWEDEPTWTEGTVYEIIYRVLWIDGVISAKWAEVTV